MIVYLKYCYFWEAYKAAGRQERYLSDNKETEMV